MSKLTGMQRTLRVLAATANGAATEVLLDAVKSPTQAIRIGAAKTLSARKDEESHRQLLLAAPGCKSDVRAAIANEQTAGRLRKTVTAALRGGDTKLCGRACRFVIDAQDHRVLPVMVELLLESNHPYALGLSSAVLQLARSLSVLIEAKRRGEEKHREDPAFARRGALQVLSAAVDRFHEHQRLELVDAFLTITTPNSPVLRRVLKDKSHAAREAVLDLLRTSHGYGAMDVLINAIEDDEASQDLLEIAASRFDRPYVERLLGRLGAQPGLRSLENARRLTGFGWTDPSRSEMLLSLGGAEQAAAIRLLIVANTTPDRQVDLASCLLRKGETEGRVAACEALGSIEYLSVQELLGVALRDAEPQVVAAAAGQLRKHDYPDALSELVELLDHPAEVVVREAQDTLSEFSFASYERAYEKLSQEQRTAAGPLVGKADPQAVEVMARDLRTPAPNRRMAALDKIAAMGLVDRLLPPVLAATRDGDVGVRAEAARALAGSRSEDAIAALAEALGDNNAVVRAAAEASLRELNSFEVAEQLIREMEEEFPEGTPGGAS